MIGEINELYQEMILDHSKRPHNFHELQGASHKAEGYNPLCGDRITVYLDVQDNSISDVAFTGTACAICTASASMMTQQIKGSSADAAHHYFDNFHKLMTGEAELDEVLDKLGKLAALAGVKRFPIRVKCATLPWHTMKAALDQPGETISTE